MDNPGIRFDDDDNQSEKSDTPQEIPLSGPVSEGMLRKQSIMEKLSVIKKRLEYSLKKWNSNNLTYETIIEGNTRENLFPKGLGFHIMSDEHASDEESSISNLQHMILSIPSQEIQDGLLIFLDDYKMQCKCVKEIKHEREELLTSVIEWLEIDCKDLRRIRGVRIEKALDAESDFFHCYQRAFGLMEKLCVLKKQIMLMDRSKKAAQSSKSAESLDFEVDSMGSVGSDSDEQAAAMYKSTCRPTDDLISIIQENKDEHNAGVMNALENKLDDISFLLSNREADIKTTRAAYRKKQAEHQRLNGDIEEMREYIESLQNKIRTLRKQKHLPEASRTGRLKKKASGRTVLFTEDCYTQTEFDVEAASSVSELPPAQIRIPRLSRAESLAGELGSDEEKRRPQRSSSQLYPSRSRSSSHEVEQAAAKRKGARRPEKDRTDKKSRAPGTLSTKELEEVTPNKNVRLLQYATPEEAAMDIEEGRRMYAMHRLAKKGIITDESDRKHGLESSSGSSLASTSGPLTLTVATADLPDTDYVPSVTQFKQLLIRHIKNCLKHAQGLLPELMALRHHARQEIEKIKKKELFLTAVEKKMKASLNKASLDREKLPAVTINMNTRDVEVTNRSREEHQCKFCVCHETTNNMVIMEDLKTAADPKKIEDMCRQYMEVLDRMRDVYQNVCSEVATGYSIIQHVLSDLVWGELGTSNYSDLDEDIDAEITALVEQVAHMPNTLRALSKHSVIVTNMVFTLVKEIVSRIQHTRLRMSDVKTQNDELRGLENAIHRARFCIDYTGLQVARLRAGENLMRNCMVLGMCRCPCCSCYNSALNDQTRTFPVDDDPKKQKLMLTRSVALLQQALSAVLRTTDLPNVQVVAGIDPRVMDDMLGSQTKLSEAVALLTNEDE